MTKKKKKLYTATKMILASALPVSLGRVSAASVTMNSARNE